MSIDSKLFIVSVCVFVIPVVIVAAFGFGRYLSISVLNECDDEYGTTQRNMYHILTDPLEYTTHPLIAALVGNHLCWNVDRTTLNIQ